jgi:hypothetical protein
MKWRWPAAAAGAAVIAAAIVVPLALAGGPPPAGTANATACEAYLVALFEKSSAPGYTPPATRPPDPPECQGLPDGTIRDLVARAISTGISKETG